MGKAKMPHLIEVADHSWQNHAHCIGMDPSTFFPTDVGGVLDAQRICADCVVREECLAYALRNRLDAGVFGGASERERRRMLKARRRGAA